MTLPDERYRSIAQARQLLTELCSPKLTPGVSAAIRVRAQGALRHFPSNYDMQRTAETSPEVFQERMEDLHKFVTKGQQEVLAREQQLKDKLEFLGLK